MDIRGLYPKVSYPVGNGTPMISPMIQWDHSNKWHVPLFAKVIKSTNLFNSNKKYKE